MRTASWSSPRPRTSKASLGLGRPDLDRDVAEDLLLEAGLDLAAGDVLALAAGQRRGVDPERHAQGRRVDVQPRQRTRVGRLGQRVADRHLGQAGDADDVARTGLLDVDPVDAVGGLQAGHGAAQGDRAAGLDGAGRVVRLLADDDDPLAGPDPAVPDPADGHPPDVVVGGQVGDEQLERVVGRVADRRRDLDEQVEQRPEVGAGHGQVAGRGAGLGVGVDDRELDLVGVRAEIHEQLVDVVEDLGRAGIAAVDLVDRDDDRQVAGHRLLEHVAGLGQRPLGRVDEQEDRVDHQQRALHLAAEVGVAGRVDDVEPDPGVVDGRLLGQDRDALLALEVARIHDPVDHRLVRAEGAGLAEHRVHERGLAVVDVGHDGDVAEVGADRGGVAG